ncbi:MAG: hypothetical protein OXK80_01690 [Bdellovibrionales bacterium]|nr:hypothetical protein [Bdellovibrionales bacterium]
MKFRIKHIFAFLFPSKKIFLLNLLLLIFMVLILFPYNDVIQKLTLKLSEISTDVHLQYDSHSLGIFPPRLILKKAELITPWTNGSAVFDRLTIYPTYLSLITFTPGIKATARIGKSKLKIILKTSFSSEGKNPPPLQIRAESQDFEIQHFQLFSPFFKGAKGLVDFFMDLKMNMRTNIIKGSIQLRAKDIFFNSYSFSQSIGTWTLPQLQWKSLEGKASLHNGRLDVQTIRIGEINDPLHLESKGFVNLKFGTLQLMREYNLELNLILDEQMKNQFFFLDLFLSNVEEKIGTDRYQYKAKITGRSSYPPKIEKL